MDASSGRPAALGSLASGHPKKKTTWSPLERKEETVPHSPTRPRGPCPSERKRQLPRPPAGRGITCTLLAKPCPAGSRAPSSPNCALAIFFFLTKEGGSAQVAESTPSLAPTPQPHRRCLLLLLHARNRSKRNRPQPFFLLLHSRHGSPKVEGAASRSKGQGGQSHTRQ